LSEKLKIQRFKVQLSMTADLVAMVKFSLRVVI